MTGPTNGIQHRAAMPATDPLEPAADAPLTRRGRPRRGRPGGETRCAATGRTGPSSPAGAPAAGWTVAPLSVGTLLAAAVAGGLGAVPVLFVGGVLGVVACSLGLLPRSSRTLAPFENPRRPTPASTRAWTTAAPP